MTPGPGPVHGQEVLLAAPADIPIELVMDDPSSYTHSIEPEVVYRLRQRPVPVDPRVCAVGTALRSLVVDDSPVRRGHSGLSFRVGGLGTLHCKVGLQIHLVPLVIPVGG